MKARAVTLALALPLALPCASSAAPTQPATTTAKPTTAKPTTTTATAATTAKPATAKPATATATAATESGPAPDDNLGHHGQLNLRAEVLTGYEMLFRYDKSPRCAPYDYAKRPADQQKFCGFGSPPALGLAIGFSLIDAFEPFAFARFGLGNTADRTNQGKMLQLGVGARLYTMSDSRFKIFFSPSIGVDLTSGPVETIGQGPNGSPGGDDRAAGVQNESFRTDILARLEIGPHYDFSRMFGAYLAGGLTFQMLRYLGASADVTIGVQMRAP